MAICSSGWQSEASLRGGGGGGCGGGGEDVPACRGHEDGIHERDRKISAAEERSLKAEEAAGLQTVPQNPKLMPDFNAIGNGRGLLQDRLLLTAPVEIESRADFITRLRRTANWMNSNVGAHMRGRCRHQTKRAAKVLQLSGAL